MKKQLGILRNRTDRLLAFKKDSHRKKNRFQMVGKEDEADTNCNPSPTQLSPSPPPIQNHTATLSSQIDPTTKSSQQFRSLRRPGAVSKKWRKFV